MLFWWIKICYFDGSKFHNKFVLESHKIVLDSHKIMLDNKIVLDSGWIPINDHGCVNNPHSSAYLSSNARWWEWILRLWRFAKDSLPPKKLYCKNKCFWLSPKSSTMIWEMEIRKRHFRETRKYEKVLPWVETAF